MPENESRIEEEVANGNLYELGNTRSSQSYLVLAKDPGAANCLSPVIERLAGKNRRVFLFCKDIAGEIFSRNFSKEARELELEPQDIVGKRTLTLLASGTSDPNYETTIIESIKLKDPKTRLILIEDFPGSLVGIMTKLASLETQVSPDLVFVTSRSSRKNMLGRFPNFGREKIIPVGQPAFDSLLLEKTQTINDRVREKLSLQPNDLLVTYSGVPSQDHPGLNIEALRQIISSLNSITETRNTNIYFVNRNHPREIDPTQFNSILDTVNDKVKIIAESQHQQIPTREITAASNLIATTISTTGLETALRGCRPQTKLEQTGWLPVHILLPQAQDFINRTAGKLPVIELKATAVASTASEVTPNFESALFDNNFKKEIFDNQQGSLRNEYRFYGKRTSTDRVLLWLRYFEKGQEKLD